MKAEKRHGTTLSGTDFPDRTRELSSVQVSPSVWVSFFALSRPDVFVFTVSHLIAVW